MWGSISTEASHQTNFNIGFSNDKCDILIHLSQWQYWWWFWFVLSWTFYYVTLDKVNKQRLLKWNPRINTSFKSRGKWGDFLAAIVPIWWCASILINSNSLMRMLEWQNETSIFTLRIRGRQWYWIYKLELKNFTDILSVPKNIGKNKWQINVFGDLKTTDDFLHIMQLRSQSKWIKDYWHTHLPKVLKTPKTNFITPQDYLKFDLKQQQQLISRASFSQRNYLLSSPLSLLSFTSKSNKYTNFSAYDTYFNNYFLNRKVFSKKKKKNISIFNTFFQRPVITSSLFYKTEDILLSTYKYFFSSITKITNSTDNIDRAQSLIINSNLNYSEYNRWFRKTYGVNSPLRFIKHTQLSPDSDLFKFRFNNEPASVKPKIAPHTTYLTIKQKRYKRKRTIPLWHKYKKLNGAKTGTIKYSAQPILTNNVITLESYWNPTIDYSLMKKAKRREKNRLPVSLNRRLLRTTRTLVLPSHVNISAITNSYDVVHSWFIPGLGLKLDCIPGRSTHHTFYIDNAGFYYGQCAEVCGRYHHHMPIRICALPFDQFLLWWHTYGLPKLLFTNAQKRYEVYYGFRKYTW